MKRLIITLALAIFVVACAHTQDPVYVARVIDGDTMVAGNGTKYRIWGIDAPEHDQPGGAEAAAALGEIVGTGQISITVKGKSYDRTVAAISVNNQDVGQAMLSKGMAYYCPQYAPRVEDYAKAEAEARAARRGLWASDNAISPAAWRRNKKAANR